MESLYQFQSTSKVKLGDKYMSNNTSDKPVKMSQFFDEKASGYEDHMKQTIPSFEEFYGLISACIVETKGKIAILDLGCGTGIELERIFSKAPNAVITCIDLSGKMLSKLKNKYTRFLDQINLIKGSYLTIPFQEKNYDYAVSVMTMHHLLPDTKGKLYKKIKKSLKNEGKYIEGDYVVLPEKEQQCLVEYYERIKCVNAFREEVYHLDIPFSVETQTQLLLKVGFSNVKIKWQENEAAIFIASIK